MVDTTTTWIIPGEADRPEEGMMGGCLMCVKDDAEHHHLLQHHSIPYSLFSDDARIANSLVL